MTTPETQQQTSQNQPQREPRAQRGDGPDRGDRGDRGGNDRRDDRALARRRESYGELRDFLEAKQGTLHHLVDKHLSSEKMIRLALAAASRTPALLECTPQSWLAALMDCAHYGLEPNPVLGHAYLVPYRNTRTGQREVVMRPGYKGLILLACDCAGFDDVDAHIVYQAELDGQLFEETPEDPVRPFRHRPLHDHVKRGQPAGAYAIGWRGEGRRPRFKYINKTQIEQARSRSGSPNDGPWVTDWEAMALKTAIRRMLAFANLRPGSKLATVLEQERGLDHGEVVRAKDWYTGDSKTARAGDREAQLHAADESDPVERIVYDEPREAVREPVFPE
jgi:phage RecT family recombinase